MIDSNLMVKVVERDYTDDQKKAIIIGFCPECFPTLTDYRILESFYSDTHNMQMLRVKCSNVAHCEWEEKLPAKRSDNGLENFFHS